MVSRTRCEGVKVEIMRQQKGGEWKRGLKALSDVYSDYTAEVQRFRD